MRRKDREVTDLREIIAIMSRCDSCSLALFDKDYPYVIPICFSAEISLSFAAEVLDGKIVLYFHCATEGHKIDLIKRDPRAAFSMSCSHELILSGDSGTMRYESVCGNGRIEIVGDAEKVFCLRAIMEKYAGLMGRQWSDDALKAVTVLKLTVANISGKRNKG